jgi:hypothetical protein
LYGIELNEKLEIGSWKLETGKWKLETKAASFQFLLSGFSAPLGAKPCRM